MKYIAHVFVIVVRVMLYIAAAAGCIITMIIVISVAYRLLFLSPLQYSDDFVSLLFSALVLLALPFLFASDANIRVSIVSERLPKKLRGVQYWVSEGLSVFFLMLLGTLSLENVAFSYSIGASTDMGQLPIAPWMALLPTSCFLSAIAILLRMFPTLRADVFGRHIPEYRP